jgi:hypothetical protein
MRDWRRAAANRSDPAVCLGSLMQTLGYHPTVMTPGYGLISKIFFLRGASPPANLAGKKNVDTA